MYDKNIEYLRNQNENNISRRRKCDLEKKKDNTDKLKMPKKNKK